MQRQRAMTIMQVPNWCVIPDHKFHKMMIGFWVRVCPQQCQNSADDQQQRIFSQKIPYTVHIVTSSCCTGCRVLILLSRLIQRQSHLGRENNLCHKCIDKSFAAFTVWVNAKG